jgi:hypothetical protein
MRIDIMVSPIGWMIGGSSQFAVRFVGGKILIECRGVSVG